MNALSEVFPDTKNLLCIWHINKNVLTKCKPKVPTDAWDDLYKDWSSLIYCNSEAEFNIKWADFQDTYSAYPDASVL